MASFFGKRNMGAIDRSIRVITGLVMIYLGFINTSVISSDIINLIVGVIGIISVVFAYLAFCPIYTLGGVSTIKKSSENG